MFKIAIFASGGGTNAAKIIDFFSSRADISVDLVISNKSDAGVLEIARENSIDSVVFSRDQFLNGANSILEILRTRKIDFLVLAGFLLKLPEVLVSSYEGRILNIHPSLLPDFGGKGMYGDNVHKAVLEAGKSKTGITIHQVNNEYDRGEIVFQEEVTISESETLDSLKKKIQVLEHTNFPRVIESEIKKLAK
ncbi:phosphoribosylglycinamide formyltransferase [Cryomorphaceae bacterium 1068]|nr:phosphoribosylglycinamide formyltransferase [Cryomorphaceae bacterium 1068]